MWDVRRPLFVRRVCGPRGPPHVPFVRHLKAAAVFFLAFALPLGCGDVEHGNPEGALDARSSAATSPATVTRTSRTSALSTPSQRHMVRLTPAGRGPVQLLANDLGSVSPGGLNWFRSDDDGLTWRHYAPILSNGIHMTADAIMTAMDVEIAISYDTTSSGFPTDSNDPKRKVYYQRWHYDGSGNWSPGALKTVASPPASKAYHRAVLQRDSQGRLWVQAWLRDPCSSSAGSDCADTLQVWVSEDDGATFTKLPDLHRMTSLGGGRMLHTASRMVILWGSYGYSQPALMMWRDDSEPSGVWHGPANAFPDGDSIYHGSAQSAVHAGGNAFDLVYKSRNEKLYYRRYDGQSFSSRQLVDDVSYYSTQPAISRYGDDLHVCVLHLVESTTPKYEVRSFLLSQGFSRWQTLASISAKSGYPTAPEIVTPDATRLPCAYTFGSASPTTLVAFRDTESAATPTPASPTPTLTPTPPPTPIPTATPPAIAFVRVLPAADTRKTNLQAHGDTVQLWRNVDDGAGFALADDGTSLVRGSAGAAFAEHRTSLQPARAGVVVGAKVFVRGERATNARGTLQVKLYQGEVLLATGVLRETTTAWTNWTDAFVGLTVADANSLRVAVEIRNTNGVDSIRYTQMWVELEYAGP